MAGLLITVNSALWPSGGELNQPEMFLHRWPHGSEDLMSKDGDDAATVNVFHSRFFLLFLRLTLLTAEENHRKWHRCGFSFISSYR